MSQPVQPQVVEHGTTFRLIDVERNRSLPVRITLHYDPADPYAVHVSFHADAIGETVSWRFDRELLATGLNQLSGIGDVRIWPWESPQGSYLALWLSTPEGNSLFEMPRSDVIHFLRRSYLAVARGNESDYLNIDAALARLFAGH